MRSIIYARVSTEEQKTGHSIEAQLEACRNYAKAKGWEIVIEYQETGSGKSIDNRTELQRALTMLKEGAADYIVVWRLDRLTRSILDFQRVITEVGPKVASVTEGLDMSSSSGRFVANLLISFAQYERESISERTKLGLRKAKTEGKRIGRKRTVPDKDRKTIKMLRTRGFTYREIAERTGYPLTTIQYICEKG